MQDILGLSLEELAFALEDLGEKSFRAEQIFSWIYKKQASSFEEMSDLPLELRKSLNQHFSLGCLSLVKLLKSSDKTEKFLFAAKDKHYLEAVAIPVERRLTACLSTQAGCKYKCFFCASGMLGFKRNLSCAEIVSQLLYLKRHCLPKQLSHLVFMGTGEPLDNYQQVIKAIRIINAKQGFAIGARRITVSTCGLTEGIRKLAKEGLQLELSVSLHAADDKTRMQIMPINKIYPLEQLMKTCRQYIRETNRQVTFEYVLIKDLNSGLKNARDLVKILRGMNCKVNLIPANPVKESGIKAPTLKEMLFFKNYLLKHGVNVTLRKERGSDIDAACGQLRLRYEKE